MTYMIYCNDLITIYDESVGTSMTSQPTNQLIPHHRIAYL